MKLRILFLVERELLFVIFFVRGRDSFKHLKGFEGRELKLGNFSDKIFEIRFRLNLSLSTMLDECKREIYIFEQFEQVMIKWKIGKKKKI